jgi:hypothetical protein
MSRNDLQRALQHGRAGALIDAVSRVREVVGDLRPDVEDALIAVRLAETAMIEAPASAPEAHRKAVDAVKAAANAGGPVDPVKAAQGLVKARAADLAANTAAEIAEIAFEELVRDLAAVSRQHGAEFLAAIRPQTMRAYENIRATVAEIPVGIDLSRPLDYGPAHATTMVALTSYISEVGVYYNVRQHLINSEILPPLTVDVGLKFSMCRDLWRHERANAIAGGDKVAGMGQPLIVPALPLPGTLDWFVRLCRAGAEFWAPTPTEQDDLARSYLTARNADAVQNAYDDRAAVLSTGRGTR